MQKTLTLLAIMALPLLVAVRFLQFGYESNRNEPSENKTTTTRLLKAR